MYLLRGHEHQHASIMCERKCECDRMTGDARNVALVDLQAILTAQRALDIDTRLNPYRVMIVSTKRDTEE